MWLKPKQKPLHLKLDDARAEVTAGGNFRLRTSQLKSGAVRKHARLFLANVQHQIKGNFPLQRLGVAHGRPEKSGYKEKAPSADCNGCPVQTNAHLEGASPQLLQLLW